MTAPWYQDGLRFRCTRCGHCCTGAPGFVWVSNEEIAGIAQHRGETVEVVTAIFTRLIQRKRSLRERPNGDCVFYDRGQGCTIYPVRPVQCRTWPFWETTVESPASWNRTCETCPGSGHGDLFTTEDILERVRARQL
jgi:Fe-S-cluster containining protein